MPSPPNSTLRVGNRTIKVSNLDKELFPGDGITKGDLIDHHLRVAEVMLPHVKDRPMTLERFPDGIEAQRFFSKDAPRYFPDWIERKNLPKKGGSVDYVVCNSKATLAYLANQAALTLHVGSSRIDDPRRPDMLIFDLDPATDDFGEVRRVAKATRGLLEEIGLVPFVKTSGSRGLHVTVPIRRSIDFDEARELAGTVAAVLVARDPGRLTTESRKEKRKGRLFFDYGRNAWAATAVAPYTVRARPGAPVAVPVEWDEIDGRGFNARRFTIKNLPRRLDEIGDPWSGWRRSARSVNEPWKRLRRIAEAG